MPDLVAAGSTARTPHVLVIFRNDRSIAETIALLPPGPWQICAPRGFATRTIPVTMLLLQDLVFSDFLQQDLIAKPYLLQFSATRLMLQNFFFFSFLQQDRNVCRFFLQQSLLYNIFRNKDRVAETSIEFFYNRVCYRNIFCNKDHRWCCRNICNTDTIVKIFVTEVVLRKIFVTYVMLQKYFWALLCCKTRPVVNNCNTAFVSET